MRKLKILHSADLHLDSAFEALPATAAAVRRREQRQLLQRMAELAKREAVDLVLLSGDLFDSENSYYETGEELLRAFRAIEAPVIIAPGNHDYYSLRSPYARLAFPGNVYVFPENVISCVELKSMGVRVYGAAFTEKHSKPLMENFRAKDDNFINLMCLHAEVGVRDSLYNAVSEEALARSGLDYAAFGHVHKASGLKKAGQTWYSWPGCPEGRGFDECGERYVNLIELEGENCQLRQVSISLRKYEQLRVDISHGDALLAIHTALPDDTAADTYRIILEGETDSAPDLKRLGENLRGLFFALEIRDETRIRRGLWESAGEDSLRGLFLSKLYKRYESSGLESERRLIEQAARWGLAALENREEVVLHEDK